MSMDANKDERWLGALALSIIGSVVTAVALWMPEEGLEWNGHPVQVQLPDSWRPWLMPDAPPPVIPRWRPEDVEELLAGYDSGWTAAMAAAPDSGLLATPDSTPPRPTGSAVASADSVPSMPTSGTKEDATDATPPVALRPTRPDWTGIPEVTALPAALRLSIPESAKPAFGRLFSRLEEHGHVGVLHYGDSQIEGDRISGVLRNAWQSRWGGYGPGLQAAVPLVQSFALRQSHDGPWRRHTRYGRRDTTDADERYGLLGCYAELDDARDGASDGRTCLGLAPEPRTFKQFARWDGVRVWHDTVVTSCTVLVDGVPVDTLMAGTPGNVLELPLSPDTSAMNSEEGMEICFDGLPPRIFALEPLGSGVQWHGVPMRGSSGTLFRKLERPHFPDQLKRLGPDLVILQYGGNMVPHCPDVAQAERYGGWFASQIRLFQWILPDAAILVIGPSDMAEKRGANWTSFPLLTAVRDALKNAALEEGAGYWDLLEVMGGPGSMPAWVASTPALAGPDHVHFTPVGAKRVGTLLDRSFLACYGEWKRDWRAPPPPALPTRKAAPLIPTSSRQSLMESHDPR